VHEAKRDCFVACDLDFNNDNQTTRVYGEILFFLRLRIKDRPLLFFHVAYVNWFKQTKGDWGHITRTHAPAHIITDRAIPISDIVCKIALIAQSAKGQKCAVLELVWYCFPSLARVLCDTHRILHRYERKLAENETSNNFQLLLMASRALLLEQLAMAAPCYTTLIAHTTHPEPMVERATAAFNRICKMIVDGTSLPFIYHPGACFLFNERQESLRRLMSCAA